MKKTKIVISFMFCMLHGTKHLCCDLYGLWMPLANVTVADVLVFQPFCQNLLISGQRETKAAMAVEHFSYLFNALN